MKTPCLAVNPSLDGSQGIARTYSNSRAIQCLIIGIRPKWAYQMARNCSNISMILGPIFLVVRQSPFYPPVRNKAIGINLQDQTVFLHQCETVWYQPVVHDTDGFGKYWWQRIQGRFVALSGRLWKELVQVYKASRCFATLMTEFDTFAPRMAKGFLEDISIIPQAAVHDYYCPKSVHDLTCTNPLAIAVARTSYFGHRPEFCGSCYPDNMLQIFRVHGQCTAVRYAGWSCGCPVIVQRFGPRYHCYRLWDVVNYASLGGDDPIHKLFDRRGFK